MRTGSRLRVLYVLPWFYPAVRYGGPIESVLRTCQELGRHVDLEVVTTDMDGPGRLDVPVAREMSVEGVSVRYFGRLSTNEYGLSPALWSFLHREISRFDLVHTQPAFSFAPTAGATAARAAGVPYIVSPRGSCQPWARGQKRWKRVPYWHLIEHRNLSRAAALHATSEEEVTALRGLFPKTQIMLVPNGVQIPESLPTVEPARRRVLFLGRLHPVKALDRLIDALSLVTRDFPDVEAVLAGPDDVGEWERLQALLSKLTPRPDVRHLGAVHGEEKAKLLASATMLVLPSHTENFGQVVVEALSHGTPVVASRHTPWKVLEERGAGRWVDNSPESLAEAIKSLLADPDRARKMGEAGMALAQDFAWPSVGDAMASAYEKVLSSRR